ncbi:hypothetical protein OSB04_006460 [Centaurea solstitialis]|uniref:Integrase catalytic domain-containing protein n=1 Tax=Centaurea solstitialis TaxID=347529 RepID=A0AA38THY7_9ASTR|nr:hypothetical protein OSB04_006460 [Centaurea solstitialis]
MDPKTHPAITVTNIKNFIPFTLEMESGQYTSWAELFRRHCWAFQVANHINSSAAPPCSTPSSSTATEADKTKAASEFEAWSRLDAIPNTTASQVWTALENIFQDNRNTRAIYLDSKFVSIRLDQHPNVSSYCQAMKMIADQLANVGNPVNNQRLVFQLIAGLNESYEVYVAEDMAVAADVAVAAPPADEDATTTPNNRHMVGDPSWASIPPPWAYPNYTQWAYPPCPHPTQQSNFRPPPSPSAGILGNRPQQAYAASEVSYTPTDLEQAFHTMAIHPPDQTWYTDTGATSHMTNNSSNFTSYVNNGLFRNVIVGIGHQNLPYPFPPLLLKNVLHTPRIIKNLLSIRRFTIDNNVSVEFDPFGLTVKEYRTRTPILRCNSTGDLYPFKLKSSSQVTHPSTFAAITRDLWPHRLGHPGADVLSTLRSNLHFSSSKHLSSNTFCHSCVLVKQIKFPFSSSNSLTHLPFDIIHTDVWTSPVLSSSGHRYYVLFLDDKTNYLQQVLSLFYLSPLLFYDKNTIPLYHQNIQCDNGREFDNRQFHNLCSQTGTQFRFSCPYTSPQNGKAECMIRSINNILRTLLAHSNVPMYLWHHALQHATYLLNILPTKTLANLTPTHILYNLQPTYTHLRTVGCLCYPLTLLAQSKTDFVKKPTLEANEPQNLWQSSQNLWRSSQSLLVARSYSLFQKRGHVMDLSEPLPVVLITL